MGGGAHCSISFNVNRNKDGGAVGLGTGPRTFCSCCRCPAGEVNTVQGLLPAATSVRCREHSFVRNVSYLQSVFCSLYAAYPVI